MLNKKSIIKYHEQLPPQHSLAEEILLGGILLNPQVVQIAFRELKTESFATEVHQLIYATIIKIYFQYSYVDSILLINSLWDLGLLGEIGGIDTIFKLLKQAQIFVSNKISEHTVRYYITLIKNKYIRRLLIQYGYDIISLSHISYVEYPTILFKAESYLTKIKSLTIHASSDTVEKSIIKVLSNLKSIDSLDKRSVGILSGFTSLDKLIHGFDQGDLIVIAGRPSMGKTSLSLNIASNLLKCQKYSISIFSLEMSREQIIYKLLSIASSIATNNIRSGNIHKNEWQKLQNIGYYFMNSSIDIDDTANLSLSQLTLKAKAIHNNSSKISLLIIDYLQLIQIDNISLSNRTEELSLITRSLKILAKELKAPIIILSQLNRNVENRINKQPMLSDLRESGCVLEESYIIQTKNNYLSSLHAKNHQEIITVHKSDTITKGSKQYTYQIVSISSKLICLTHNHMICDKKHWFRNDAFKYFFTLFHLKIQKSSITGMLYMTKMIKFMQKTYVQDIVMYETKNFVINDNIIIHNSIEQDADLVLLLYRESYYKTHQNDNDVTDIIIAKHRNGPVGTAELYFRPETSIFANT